MSILKSLIRQTEKINFLFPNNFKELMKNEYYDYDKFEWFLYYVFKLDGDSTKPDKLGKKGKVDGDVSFDALKEYYDDVCKDLIKKDKPVPNIGKLFI